MMTANAAFSPWAFRVVALLLVVSLVLALLPFVAHAWWYNVWRHVYWRVHCMGVGCGLPAGTTLHYRYEGLQLYRCHDGSGTCYPTGTTKEEWRGQGCYFGCFNFTY